MRFSLSLLALAVAMPGWADTIAVDSQVREVTLHPGSVTLTRRATADVPAGRHRLEIRGIPEGSDLESLQVDLQGARLIGTVYRTDYTPPDDYTNDAVRAAEDRIEQVEQRIQAVHDQAERARTGARAADISIAFLKGLGDNEGLAEAGPDALRQISRMVAEEAGRASDRALSAEIEARRVELQLKDLAEELEEAQAALRAIALEDEDRLYLGLEIEAAEAGPVELSLTYFSLDYVSGWEPVYMFDLITGDQSRLRVDRDALVQQQTGENWTDVTLRLTTADPDQRMSPGNLRTQLLRIEEPTPQPKLSSRVERGVSAMAEPVVEAPMIIEEAADPWTRSEGVDVTYQFAEPVTLHSGADVLRLDLDTLETPGDMFAQAVPRSDETAYRIVRFTNTFNEELLPSEEARFLVDGEFIGFEPFFGLVAGDEVELSFGQIDGLRLTRGVLNRNEGDEGILSRSNRKDEQVEIKVENLTADAWPLRLLDRVPYSEQEDLEITWSASPRPSEENPENRRGILAWDLEMAPGATQTIRLNSSISWPEGMVLR